MRAASRPPRGTADFQQPVSPRAQPFSREECQLLFLASGSLFGAGVCSLCRYPLAGAFIGMIVGPVLLFVIVVLVGFICRWLGI
jgi:hypothetical protein